MRDQFLLIVGSPRCGELELMGQEIEVLKREGKGVRDRRAVTSHVIRRVQRGRSSPTIDEDLLTAIWRSDRLPPPQRQCDLLISLIGENQPSWSEPAKLRI